MRQSGYTKKHYETANEMIIPYYCEDYPEEGPEPSDVPSKNAKGQARGECKNNKLNDAKSQKITQQGDGNSVVAKEKESDKEQIQGKSIFPEKKRKSDYTD